MSVRCERVDLGGYAAFFWRRPDPFFRSLALPVDQRANGLSSLKALVRAFRARQRQPRLEFFVEDWGDLPNVLCDQGWQRESMTASMFADLPPQTEADPNIIWLSKATPEESLLQFLRQMSIAFGMDGKIDPTESECLHRSISAGQTIAAALTRSGEIVSGAALTQAAGVAELQGVWTSPGQRHQGLAKTICTALLQRYLTRFGNLVWLSAEPSLSCNFYRKLGFRRLGTQVNFHLERTKLSSSPDEISATL